LWKCNNCGKEITKPVTNIVDRYKLVEITEIAENMGYEMKQMAEMKLCRKLNG
jgi:ribosomal protein L37AE/L43A